MLAGLFLVLRHEILEGEIQTRRRSDRQLFGRDKGWQKAERCQSNHEEGAHEL